MAEKIYPQHQTLTSLLALVLEIGLVFLSPSASATFSAFCLFLNLKIDPPHQMTVGTTQTNETHPSTSVAVPHPALCLTSPASRGPIIVPPA